MRRWLPTLFALLVVVVPLHAAPREARIPLHEGKIRLADLSEKLLTEMHLKPRWISLPGTIDVHDVEGTLCVDALNHAFGEGCRVTLQGDALVLHLDREKLPKDWDGTKIAIRVFTSFAAPESTAAQQRRYGFLLPKQIDENRRLVVLIHGLACTRDIWTSVIPLLEQEGYQVATFSYPAAQGIGDSAEFFSQHMKGLRELYPRLKVDVVTHSMGSLVARAYVEGPAYQGGVEHLVLLTPPNHGSSWARAEFAAKAMEHYELWRHDPEWRWTWMVTDGLGEAARDLMPDSPFLRQLNAVPRREGVRYTIVAGTLSPTWRIAANVVGAPAGWVPKRVANCWGFRQCRHGLENASASLRGHQSDNDGPVSLASARLAGVDDFVMIHEDHAGMLSYANGKAPAVWEIVRERLRGKNTATK